MCLFMDFLGICLTIALVVVAFRGIKLLIGSINFGFDKVEDWLKGKKKDS